MPAIYGTRKRARADFARRASATRSCPPSRARRSTARSKVDDGGYSWEWRVIDGRKVLCKIKRKARYEQVAETVMVQPEHKRRVVIPAEYDYEAEQVLIQPEQQRVIDIPASYQTVSRRCLVREGTSGWQRVRIPQALRRLSGRSGYASARSQRFRPSTSPFPTAAATRRPTAAPNL